MKNFMLMIFALLILVVFGGTAYFLTNISSGSRFERVAPSDSK
jgi:hypothetical protein